MAKIRCKWCGNEPLYQKYHDEEWGKPVYDDAILFEFLVLESFQAGLSWWTILRKRKHFREAFDEFNYHNIAQYSSQKVEYLMNNEKIVRHRAKILATINNAQKFMDIQREFGSFSKYIWAFSEGNIVNNQFNKESDVPSKTALSDQIAKDLKKRGFKFLGSTTVYAYLQSIGIINDHIINCIAK